MAKRKRRQVTSGAPARSLPAKRQIDARFPSGPPPGVAGDDLTGKLIVIEGPDGSGRSTQVVLLKEWLESEGYGVATMGLRRSNLLARNIDVVLAHNVVTRLTLALMYATDFYDQLQRLVIPALRAGFVVLADRYIFSLMARAAVRGIDRQYLEKIYAHAVRPDVTFRFRVSPEVAFDREFSKAPVISYWESGRDMYLADDLYHSFVQYQRLMLREFERLAKRHTFIDVDGEAPIPELNAVLRQHIATLMNIRNTRYQPTSALRHLWR
ncbi:MAG TPA: thymidylate kinase [Polyangiaceae bacterium]|jgi:dTMP kinase